MSLANNISELCRVCLKLPPEVDLLDLTTIYDEDEHLTYGECFLICTHINLNEDNNLPHNLCKLCGLELQMTYDFYKKVEESKNFLQQYQQKIEDVVNDDHAYEVVKNEYSENYRDDDAYSTAKELPASSNSNIIIQEIPEQISTNTIGIETQDSQRDEEFVEISAVDSLVDMVEDDTIVEEVEEEEDDRLSQADDSLVMEEHLEINDFNTEQLEDEDSKLYSESIIEYEECLPNENIKDDVQLEDTAHIETLTIIPYLRAREKIPILGDGPPFICELCGHESPSKALLSSHRHRKHRLKENKPQCPKCEKCFENQGKLERHIKRFVCEPMYPISKYVDHLAIMNDKKDSKPKSNSENNSQTAETLTVTPYLKRRERKPISEDGPPFICEICDHESPSKALLSSHRHRKHRYNELLPQCSKCEKYFENQQKLDRHLERLRCEPNSIFTCEYCSKEILGPANYKIHLRFHQKTYPFKCKQCEKGFMLTAHLKNHVRVKHENKRYVCEEPGCGRTFQSASAVRDHMYVHLNSLPYRCEYCKNMYPNKGKLNWHIKKAHGIVHTIEELDCMLVAGEIVLNMKPKDVDSNNQ